MSVGFEQVSLETGDNGIAKNPWVVEGPELPDCADGMLHHFRQAGQFARVIHSEVNIDGKTPQEVIIIQGYYCRQCLTHVYVEIAKKKHETGGESGNGQYQ